MSDEIILSNLLSWQFIAGRERLGKLSWLAVVVFYAALVNLPFWLASRWLGIMPVGLFCVEYALIGILGLILPRSLTAVLLVCMIALDVLSGVSKTYYLAPTECLANLASLHELSAWRVLAVAVVAFITLVSAFGAVWICTEPLKNNQKLYAAVCLLLFAFGAVWGDCNTLLRENRTIGQSFFGRPPDSRQAAEFQHLWLGRYPVLRLIKLQHGLGPQRLSGVASLTDAATMQSASSIALAAGGIKAGMAVQRLPNVVLVLTESWGIAQNVMVRSALTRPYFEPGILARYRVIQGTLPFHGATIAGEARELCDSRIGSQIMDVPGASLKSCLPQRLAALGYQRTALHGMNGNMFRRVNWYTAIGFQQQQFKLDFDRQGLPDCEGAFKGTCDGAVAGWIKARLAGKSENPNFIYWVTLNSHLPVRIPAEVPDPAPCSFAAILEQQPAFCSWYQLISNVHSAVAQVALSNLDRRTVFVVVGDHAPPFSSSVIRSEFSATEVPYIVLLPREVRQSKGRLARGRFAKLPAASSERSSDTTLPELTNYSAH